MLAKRLGLDAERIEMIRLSSPMHDVGKIGISDQVLLKPGKLAPKEREAMERHARIGHDILAGSHVEMFDMAARIALTHHEKVDGSGYPNGLKGDEIPLEGRIVAVADVFDALTSDRVYRKAFDFEQAIEMMREGRGTHFDPRLLDVLLADLESFRRVSERH
jgi:putative two-component system response regulator